MILQVCGRDRELWTLVTKEVRDSRISVKFGKSDWLRIRNEYIAHTQKIGSGQSSRSLPHALRIVGSGDENEFSSPRLKFGLVVLVLFTWTILVG